jgi:hypothetical protein
LNSQEHITISPIKRFVKTPLTTNPMSAQHDWFHALDEEWKNLLETQYGITSSADRSKLEEITVLDCKDYALTHLNPVAEMKNLCAIECENGSISDLSPLEELSNLEQIKVSGKISDLTPLRNLPRLRNVTLVRIDA